ncbi:Target of rapamycin complex 2 subunit avo2 [Vermiconidia calcicola]|uniref:Target of rapamycin complex 2 subunit avo2 n=1 Tax=Vermiconidia calcicola TaxID=1690605 RepID=A0ACC3NY88_9PEZI|nr:Target of rapamycin complex 2 subunit avo2 [Vermiconidia calcicola]
MCSAPPNRLETFLVPHIDSISPRDLLHLNTTKDVAMIPPSTRLRRAIHLNDALLVQRIIRNSPHLLRNPDFDDKSNTSLHLAASHGFTLIVEHLIHAGHEDGEISRNTDHDTPLMLAARNGHVEVGRLLVQEFPRSTAFKNKLGLDALCLAAQNPGSTSLIPILLNDPASPHVRDNDGNTPLHHASASGSLKALRILLAAGANPLAKNTHDWTPLAYSQTVAAEVYFKNLVAELERRKVEGLKAEEERERQKTAGLRVVATEDEGGGGGGGMRKPEPGSIPMTPVDDEEVIHDALKRHWSPTVERSGKRPITPGSAGKGHEWDSRLVHIRTRSGSGGER